MTSPTGGDGTIRLHKSTYMAQAIRDAIKVFEDFASFEMTRDGDYYLVQVTNLDPEVDGDLAGEFCNFALVHTIERKRRTPGAAGGAA
ncbi:MAG: hypothetical protein H6747_02270 [Deltaproteobacteria bacterium]|nr:hypothetical protein [Deltaproteobacteria bacterium]